MEKGKRKINRWKRTGSYTYQKKLPVKDNRSIYGDLPGNGYYDKPLSQSENSSKLRVPKLCRKGAWKRFYKLFPELKGKKVISGSPASVYNGLNKSTIKLKKTKK